MAGGEKNLSLNRKARQLYSVLENLECGIELKGTEVKSMKSAKFSYSDAYAAIDNGELWLIGFHISPYDFGNIMNHDPDRRRRLLVHKREVKWLKRQTDEKGLTLVPLRFYLKRSKVKCELGVCRGKKLYNRREDIKKRDLDREAERELRHSI